MAKQEELREKTLEEQVGEIRKELCKALELLLPPKEVRREFVRNLWMMELSFWKAIKTLVDYQVEKLEKRTEVEEKREKVKRIQVE